MARNSSSSSSSPLLSELCIQLEELLRRVQDAEYRAYSLYIDNKFELVKLCNSICRARDQETAEGGHVEGRAIDQGTLGDVEKHVLDQEPATSESPAAGRKDDVSEVQEAAPAERRAANEGGFFLSVFWARRFVRRCQRRREVTRSANRPERAPPAREMPKTPSFEIGPDGVLRKKRTRRSKTMRKQTKRDRERELLENPSLEEGDVEEKVLDRESDEVEEEVREAASVESERRVNKGGFFLSVFWARRFVRRCERRSQVMRSENRPESLSREGATVEDRTRELTESLSREGAMAEDRTREQPESSSSEDAAALKKKMKNKMKRKRRKNREGARQIYSGGGSCCPVAFICFLIFVCVFFEQAVLVKGYDTGEIEDHC